MSESRNSESRSGIYTTRHSSSTSESRNENWQYVRPIPYSKAEPSQPIITNQKPNYNNLDSIDALIEKLEGEIPKDKSASSKVNDAYASRKRKIEELRDLQRQAREEQARQKKIAEAEKDLPKIQEGNDELDEAIAQVKQMIKKPVYSSHSPDYMGWDDGESHDGESRW